MSSQTHVDATVITHESQLIGYLESGFKPRERWVIGTEHEKLGWWPDRQRPPTYEGERGIGRLLETLVADAGWIPTHEGDAIIALTRDQASITLEPGGQLELSGAPLRTLAEMVTEFDAHVAEIRTFSKPLGIEWSGMGYHPWGTPTEMPLMPKARYGVMTRYLPTRGGLALHMMRSTCTVQANYDFASEADAMRKLRASLLVQPMVLAMFANSPFVKGKLTPYQTFRGQIWLDTDNDRYVYPRAFLDPAAGFAEYVEWALDVPMFFIWRDETYIEAEGLTFRRFLQDGLAGHVATMGDFALHLSTLFPDARLKTHLEVRGADMGDRDHVLGLPALHAGFLYDEAALDVTLELVGGIGYDEIWAARKQVPTAGFSTPLGGRTIQKYAQDLVRIAADGLSRWEPGTVSLLDPLKANADAGHTQADDLRALNKPSPSELLAKTRIA